MNIHRKFDFHTVTAHDYAVVRKTGGLAIRNDTSTLMIFLKERDGSWTMIEAGHEDCRDVSLIEPDAIIKSPAYLGRGLLASSESVGNSAGTGIANVLAKRKAKKGSGLRIRLKSLDHPEVFIPIPEDVSRVQAFEAVSQFFEMGKVEGRKIDFPHYMQNTSASPRSYRSKTLIEGDPGEALVRFFKHPGTLAVLCGGFGFLAHNVYSFTERHGGFENAFPEDKAGFFVFLALAIVFGCLSLSRWKKTKRQQ